MIINRFEAGRENKNVLSTNDRNTEGRRAALKWAKIQNGNP